MNSRIIKPLIQFLKKAESGVWLCDFQFKHINYANQELSCTINAGVSKNETIFVVDIESENDCEGCGT